MRIKSDRWLTHKTAQQMSTKSIKSIVIYVQTSSYTAQRHIKNKSQSAFYCVGRVTIKVQKLTLEEEENAGDGRFSLVLIRI